MENDSFLSVELAKERLQEELTASVLLRCKDKKITTDLSGGLDSSTLTWIAAKQYPVQSLTLIGKEENEDIQIAGKLVKEQSDISHAVFSQGEIPSIYSNMDNIFSDSPIPFYWSASQAEWVINWAKKAGSDIHFSGEGGDTVLGADYTYLIDLVQNRKWREFLDHARGWAKEKKQSPWNWILGTVLRSFNLPFHCKQRHPLSTTYNQADWIIPSKKIEHYRFSKNLGLSQTLKGIHYLGYVAHGLKNLAEQQEVSICFPYLDHNVIQICMKVALSDKMNPYELKPLLKRAFQNQLPEYLLNRNTKGDYTSDVYQGMEENLSWFQENFQEMFLADMGLIDVQKFQKCFIRLMNGVPVKLPEFHHTLSLEMWLRQIKNDQNEVDKNASMFT
ncbi:asparagine synthase-related protein [Shimazuella kribbensis]|uniref:asparagine synthase-related protein n=1 Tax=Shimazuella kribbensis TaxID=139808 RepID=UPI0003FF2BDC|nr:asparagine synthase-related protein [Shimazuella kribbensis]